MRKKKYSKPSEIITDYQEKQLNNLNKSIEETADTSKSFLGPMVLIILVLVAVFSSYYAVSNVGQKSLQTKLKEVAHYVENNQPSWRNLRLLGYQQNATQLTTGYNYNNYFSVYDVRNLPEDLTFDEFTEQAGKLYGQVVIGINNGEFITDIPRDDNGQADYFNNPYTITLRINDEPINCVQFYGLTLYSTGKIYNPYSQYGEIYIPARFIDEPDDYVSGVPVYTLTGDLVSPTYSEDSISAIFSGFKLITNVALTGVDFIHYCLGLIWVIFT